MTYQSHLAWAAGAAVSVWSFRYGFGGFPGLLPELVAFMFAAIVGGMLPDIDHPQSWLGRRIPLIPSLLFKTTGHRGATHSMLAIVLTTGATGYGVLQFDVAYTIAEAAAIGMFVGYLSHLAGDFVSNRGIPVFWPSKKRFGIPLCSTGSAGERVATIVIIFLCGAATLAILVPVRINV